MLQCVYVDMLAALGDTIQRTVRCASKAVVRVHRLPKLRHVSSLSLVQLPLLTAYAAAARCKQCMYLQIRWCLCHRGDVCYSLSIAYSSTLARELTAYLSKRLVLQHTLVQCTDVVTATNTSCYHSLLTLSAIRATLLQCYSCVDHVLSKRTLGSIVASHHDYLTTVDAAAYQQRSVLSAHQLCRALV
jgi:hypothetical protein